MNLLINGALLGTLLLPVPPFPGGAAAERVTVAAAAPEPSGSAAVWPLTPRPDVVRGFEPPSTTWAAGHRGVDLLGAAGAEIRSALAGEVAFAATVAGRGVVVVDHGDFRTTYEPVRAAVRRGDQVRTGDVLGTLETGLSHCPPRFCLHWGLVVGDEYEDPLTLIQPGRVRLLPSDDQALGWARW